MLAIAFLLQAAGPVAAQPALQRCTPTTDSDEVVVCGRRGDSPYRLKPLPPHPDDAPRNPLRFALPGGGSGRLHAIESELPTARGAGLAVSLAIPLGAKRKP